MNLESNKVVLGLSQGFLLPVISWILTVSGSNEMKLWSMDLVWKSQFDQSTLKLIISRGINKNGKLLGNYHQLPSSLVPSSIWNSSFWKLESVLGLLNSTKMVKIALIVLALVAVAVAKPFGGFGGYGGVSRTSVSHHVGHHHGFGGPWFG